MTERFRRELVALVPKLRRFAYALTGNRQDGDDLVQAACERALRNLVHYRAGTRMDSWMYRIIQRLWAEDHRRARRFDDAEPVGLGDEERDASLPEDRMRQARTRAAIADLPDVQRAVVALVVIEGLSYREAADVLDLPVGAVMSRLSHAREVLLPRLCLLSGRRP